MLTVRTAALPDLPRVGLLIEEYMAELFNCPWSGGIQTLVRDGLGACCEIMVVHRDGGEPEGFAAWQPTYDLHHCIPGGTIIDLFVRRALRNTGAALALAAGTAAAIHAKGGRFMSGLAVGEPATRRLYERVAVSFVGADCIVGGRAFRELAALAGRSPKEIVRGLPGSALNHEP